MGTRTVKRQREKLLSNHTSPGERQLTIVDPAEALQARRGGAYDDAAAARVPAQVVDAEGGGVDDALEVDVEDGGGGLPGVAVLVELDAGDVVDAGADAGVGEDVVDLAVVFFGRFESL